VDSPRDIDPIAGIDARKTRSAERTRSVDRGGSALPGASHPPKFETPLTLFLNCSRWSPRS